jgi:tetratricopeptide (TPR) repeat protein
VLRSVATIIADTLVSLWTVMKPLGMFLVDILKRLGIAIYEAAKSFEFLFKSIQSLIKFNLSEAQRNLEIFKDRFLGAFSDAWQGVKEDSRKNWEDLKEGWNQMLKTFPEMAKMTLGDLAQQWEQYADRVLKLFPSFEERQKKTEALMGTTKKHLQGVAQAAEEVSKAVDRASESFQRMSVQAVINSRKVEALLNLLGVPKMTQRPVAPNLRELMERITFESGGNVNTEAAAEMLRAANIPVGGMTRGASALELLGPEVFQIRQFQEEIEQNKAKLDILRQLGEQEVELTEEIQKRKEEAIKAYNERLKELTLAQSVLLIKQYESAFGELANALEWFADEQVGIYEAMFAVSKAFALADAIIKIQQGIAQALVLPFPANLAAMAQIISATASIVSTIQSVTMTIAGERAMGGPVQRNRTYLVGEKGPELFTPSQSGFIIPNDRLAMGGSVQVIVNNFTDAQAEVRERQIGEKRVIEVMIKRLKQELSSDIRDGRGDFVRAIESTYRLRR